MSTFSPPSFSSGADSEGPQRWYDKDPALSKALESLRKAPSSYQAQIALNIIGVIVEHHTQVDLELEQKPAPLSLMEPAVERLGDIPRKRWYDVNSSLRSAMQLLQDTPPEYQARIIPNIANMIELTLERHWEASNF
jgi:hypothetical protein